MRTEVTAEPLEAVDADLHVTGLAQGEEPDDAYRELPGAGDARGGLRKHCLLYTSPSPRDGLLSRMPSSA